MTIKQNQSSELNCENKAWEKKVKYNNKKEKAGDIERKINVQYMKIKEKERNIKTTIEKETKYLKEWKKKSFKV